MSLVMRADDEEKRNSLIDQRKKKINKHSLHVRLMNIVIDRDCCFRKVFLKEGKFYD